MSGNHQNYSGASNTSPSIPNKGTIQVTKGKFSGGSQAQTPPSKGPGKK